MKRIASIDIGSQTIRLLVAEAGPGSRLNPICRDRLIVRLGEGMNETKRLKNESIERAVQCIRSFVLRANEQGASRIFPVATACIRNAENARDFLEKVYFEAGIMPEVVSGEEEARLSLKGVQSVLSPFEGRALIIDIGGGSTECILVNNKSIASLESMPLGVIGLSEKHLRHDPPLPQELAFMQEDILRIIKSQCSIINSLQEPPSFAGTAGTVTTLAAMNLKMTRYDPDTINGYQLQRSTIEALYTSMNALPRMERSLMPGLEQGRAVVISG